jgi:hypothetical protein
VYTGHYAAHPFNPSTPHTPRLSMRLAARYVSVCSLSSFRLHTCSSHRNSKYCKRSTCTADSSHTDTRRVHHRRSYAGTRLALTRSRYLDKYHFMRLTPSQCRWRAGGFVLASCMRDLRKKNLVHEVETGLPCSSFSISNWVMREARKRSTIR